MREFRLAALLALTLGAAACGDVPRTAAGQPTAGRVDRATAQRIERRLRLPDGARAVDRYARFYFIDEQTPPGMISGWFVGVDGAPGDVWPRAGVHLRKPTIGVADGGCFVISLTYDPARDRIVDIHCNGYA
ncbi:MAG: hypothetical protein K1X35_07660 [Caulobacteraceae bacterium]|nr:hypothetical protein [Caulobacteraceae bacterium]